MNRVILIGRLTKDPDVRYGGADSQTAIARYTLAVDRPRKREGEQNTDFISCVTFGKAAEFAEKWLSKGMKIAITGSIQTGSYTNKDGQKVYTTNVIAETHEFVESKNSSGGSGTEKQASGAKKPEPDIDGFMNIPDGIDEELPFA
jgi:single-strand DNA-binding protein